MSRAAVLSALLVGLAGCASTPRPIFPTVDPPLVWPAPPDAPRIRYVGELRGEASLGIQPTGWEAVRAALGGPRPQVEFSHPTAVAVAGERIFVADTGLGAVHLLDLAARQYKLLRGSPADTLRVPIDLTINANQLVVVDRGRAALDLFDLDGNWRATRRWPEITAPVAVACDPQKGTLWIADAAAHACFVVADLQTVAGRLGAPGTAPGQFNFPTALAWRPIVGLVVADAMNFRVQVFDTSGQPTAVFGHKGDAAGCFARPRGVAVDSEGHIYVADNQFENIQVFDAAGHLLLAFGEEGDRPGQFSLPAGITIDTQDRIWVADSYNRRVQVFQYVAEKER
jgi:DNA-binding beta-propeller fold protein YncE